MELGEMGEVAGEISVVGFFELEKIQRGAKGRCLVGTWTIHNKI